MKLNRFFILSMVPLMAAGAQRNERLLSGDGWQFTRGELTAASRWENVNVPHDWAIYGPFSRENDLQFVAIEQNGETECEIKTGRTGGLPYIGKGHYRKIFTVDSVDTKAFTLLFDGAMSNASVKVNGKDVGQWRYGYNSFFFPIDDVVTDGENLLEVSLENLPESSRWYPGAGLYRNVYLIETSKIHIPVWGVRVTTPQVYEEYATVRVDTEIEGTDPSHSLRVETTVADPAGKVVAHSSKIFHPKGQTHIQNMSISDPLLWSPESPSLYSLSVAVYDGDECVDVKNLRFGIRSIEYVPFKGFFLNGIPTKFKGVCNHHDLGPLGTAVNRSALRHQLAMLKDMGCNAIRTSHNMPAPELVELCDEMGLMMMIEPFDDWSFRPKCRNGYGSYFNEWAERDMVNMVRHYRNNPSVVMWSVGNEVPSQWGPEGVKEMLFLQDICHREDPTRPVTCGMDQINSVLDNGFAASVDIPGFNYKVPYYKEAFEKLPQGLILGSETASTFSARGVYKFPVMLEKGKMYDDHMTSSYDTECAVWSNIPDEDFAADDDLPWMIGQFVWTGFDYLGEPTPYDNESWPSHSSNFGIIDLASIPKDRFYLYRSVWNTSLPTLHILPHWNWPGREGEITPVMVYTSYPEAELFVNGNSQGRRTKNPDSVLDRYRLIWPDVVYQPGEVTVVAYDSNGTEVARETICTSGKPSRLKLTADRTRCPADGKELVYVTVRVVDKNGIEVPDASDMVRFDTSGPTRFVATANGDPTCLLSFQNPQMKLFNGACTCIIAPDELLLGKSKERTLKLTVSAPGLKSSTIEIPIE